MNTDDNEGIAGPAVWLVWSLLGVLGFIFWTALAAWLFR
jgi:hypothetical protein